MLTQSFYQPSKSLNDRLFTAEFDDALLEQPWWKNPRHYGSKLTAKAINHYTPKTEGCKGIGCVSISGNPGLGVGAAYIGSGNGLNAFTVGGLQFLANAYPYGAYPSTPGVFQVYNGGNPNVTWFGDSTHPGGLQPLLKNETTALYIANTVIGGEEDEKYAIIRDHSYVNINQILLINPITDEVQLLEKATEPFEAFHRFITTDFPTGGSFSIKLIDESISHNLKGPEQYKVKMNKGFLLTSFDFVMAPSAPQLTENNSMFLYKGGQIKEDMLVEGVLISPSPTSVDQEEYVRFRYGTVEIIPGSMNGRGHILERERIGPNFASSSIIENKFTKIYYSGSFGLINDPSSFGGSLNRDIMKNSGLGSASRFIGLNSLKYLRQNNKDPNLTNQEKTELHITFFEGTKDFSISETINSSSLQFLATGSANDERSIGTFEIDSNQEDLDIGGICNDYLPKSHEIRFKAPNDDRFQPRGHRMKISSMYNGYVTRSLTMGGCVNIGEAPPNDAVLNGGRAQLGLNLEKLLLPEIYVQGGILGEVGYTLNTSASDSDYGDSLDGYTTAGGDVIPSSVSQSNRYSGSFRYQLSWLDKDHTIISNVNKNTELFDGIGTKGVVLIPRYVHPKIKNNINYYLQQAGIIDSSPNTQLQVIEDK